MKSNNTYAAPTPAGWRVPDWAREAGGFSRAHVYNMINDGQLETAKVGKARVILTSPRDFLARHVEKRG